MSAEQLENTLMKLPREERRRFAQWFYQHEDDLLEPREEEVHPAIQAEIMRRRDEADAHPERLEPWEGTTDRVRARLHELRRQKAQDR